MHEMSSIYEAPLHGYRGDKAESETEGRPGGWTLAISREAGARGGTIAHRVAELLDWQVFTQESIDYMLQQETARQQLESELPAASRQWLEQQRQRLKQQHWPMEEARTLADLLLVIAARGDAVIVGRGAGFLLPPVSTIHVRIVAPFTERVAWLAQLLRLSRDEAEREVQARDQRRQRFLQRLLGADAIDPHVYNAVLNSGHLGVEACAQILGWMVRTRQALAAWSAQQEPPLTESGLWDRP